jgi:ABC-type transporter Mla subunit MlaD
MSENGLLALAQSVQSAHARLSAEVRDRSEQARYLVDEVERRLEQLVTALRERSEGLDALHDAIADRMNNLMMAIKTASDLLRDTPSEEEVSRVREQLDATVESGREAVKRLRDAVRPIR